jgi:hypothetical protein
MHVHFNEFLDNCTSNTIRYVPIDLKKVHQLNQSAVLAALRYDLFYPVITV